MKGLFFGFVLVLSSLCGLDSSTFINDDLKQLLKVMEVPHNGTLPSIMEATQKSWARPAGKEIWHIENNLSETQAKAVMEFCSKNRFFTEILPAKKSYDYAVLHGATVATMRKRIAFLEKIAKSGVEFKQVVLLSGARPLDPEIETIPEGCKTEGDVMEYLWKAHPLSKQVPWKHFEAPMVTVFGSKVRRPTTVDTYLLWLSTKPKAGSCFMVSSQPYCHHQHFIAEALMPKEFTFETVGSGVDPATQNPAAMLDKIALCIYVLGHK